MKIKEADIQRACEDFLQLHGWRIIRQEQNYSERKRKVIGERGMPDCLALHYATGRILWIEFKRPRGIVSPIQRVWHTAERARGAATVIFGQDCDASIGAFMVWYARNYD